MLSWSGLHLLHRRIGELHTSKEQGARSKRCEHDAVPGKLSVKHYGYRVGDIVTRCGDDLHFVASIDDDRTGTFICLRAPEDGWCKFGDKESNLLRRYSFVRAATGLDVAPCLALYPYATGDREYCVKVPGFNTKCY